VSFQFTGIHNLTLDLGDSSSQQFTVNNTFTDSTGKVTIDLGSGASNMVTVLRTGAPLVVTGTGSSNLLVVDNSTATSATTSVPPTDIDTPTSRLAGFGPVADLTFSGIAEIDLKQGSASDVLSLNTSVSSLAVKAFGNGGDDTYNVSHVGQSMV